MGSSRGFNFCDDAQLWGWTWNDLFLLGLYVWPLVEADWQKFEVDPFFFPYNEHRVGSIKAFEAGSGIRGRLSELLWGACSLPAFASELQSLH